MKRKRNTYKPKYCYGGYENRAAEKPMVCVSATTIADARQAIAAWCDLMCQPKALHVRKHTCTLPCAHTHWVVEGQIPSVPVRQRLYKEDRHTRAMRRQEKMLESQNLN